jgi:nitronate monooxygenase/enoyl-[acyl-carrier protein] reductase II
VKVEFANSVFPPPSPGGWQVRPRVLRTAWVERWNERPDEAAREAQRLQGELMGAVREGRAHELVPFTGQTVGLIDAVLPVERILAELVEDAERALRAAAG